jgi:glutamate/tyrosine decarboxylase-like PLP-dependent enzyme
MTNLQLQSILQSDQSNAALLDQAAGYAREYIDGIPNQRVVPGDEALAKLSTFDEGFPGEPADAQALLAQLHQYGSPATSAQIGGRYFGFVNGGAVPAAVAARWLADVWDQNAAMHVISPIASKLEQVCERWLKEIFGLPDETVIGLVGGTSTATMCGLAAARYSILKRQGWEVNEQGLMGAPTFRVVASEGAHGTVFKALALLGIGRQQVELIPMDDQGRIVVDRLPELDANTLLILQAGNVNTGAFDQFEVIQPQLNGAWVHIDGAFGLWAAASPEYQHLTRGIAAADSWSVDGHKTLNTPYDCGIVLCKHPQALVSAMQASGDYLVFSEQRDGMLYGPDMSRRARSIELWATLKYLGRSGLAEMIDGLCERAAEFGERLQGHGFRVLNDVVFNQVLIAGRTPAETEATLANVQASGRMWCGGSTWNGEPAIRISVCSWATTSDDVVESVAALVAARAAKDS